MNLPSIPKSFFNGDCFDAYRILGAHPWQGDHGEEGWRFAVWAPNTASTEPTAAWSCGPTPTLSRPKSAPPTPAA